MIAAMLAAVLASTMGGVPVPAVGSVASLATTDGASTTRTVVAPGDEPAVRVTLNSQNVFDPGDASRSGARAGRFVSRGATRDPERDGASALSHESRG